MTVTVRPERLDATRSRLILGLERAAWYLNCNPGRGVWELSLRQRRFQTPPVREWDLTETETVWTAEEVPDSVSAVVRSGQTHVFSSRSNALIVDTLNASCGPMPMASKTEILRFALSAPASEIPTGATGLQLKVRVLRQADPDSDVAVPVVDDYVKVRRSGADIGSNVAVGTEVPDAPTWIEYTINLSALGVTVAQINAGNIDAIDLGWKTIPETAYVAGDFDIEYSASGTETAVATGYTDYSAAWTSPTPPASFSDIVARSGGEITGGSVICTQDGTVTIEASTSDPLTYVILDVTSIARGSGDESGTSEATSDNGLGTVPTTSYFESESSGSKKFRVNLTAGVGTLPITVSAYGANFYTGSDLPGEPGATAEVQVSATVAIPDSVTLLVDAVLVSFCYTASSGATVELIGAQGLGYGDFGGVDEYQAIWGEGAFKVAADKNLLAMGSNWSAELAAKRLGTGKFVQWQYADRIYAVNPSAGAYYRTIGTTTWTTLFEDTQSPGSTGDASYVLNMPAYAENGFFDASSGVDTIAMVTSSGRASGSTAVFAPLGVDAKPKIVTTDSGGGYGTGQIAYEITLATARDWSEGNVLTFRLAATNLDGTEPSNDGFWNGDMSLFTLTLTDGSANDDVFPVKIAGVLNTQQGYCYCFVDLTNPPTVDLTDITKIAISFNAWMTGTAVYSLGEFNVGGVIYHDIAGSLSTKSDLTEATLDYAYWFTEGSSTSQAKKLVVAAKEHLGRTRSFAGYPDGGLSFYGGSQVTVTVPTADSPYTSAATIHLARLVDGDWQEVETGPNTGSLVFRDTLPDSVLAADTTTYPIVTPDFDSSTPLEGGAVSGVICGCAWKQSNVYASTNGKIYFSRVNAPNEVLWDNVTLTNEIGSEDLGPARTAVLADNTSDYAVCMVPAGNLYCFTYRDAWVFVEGDTAATASFPRRIDGVRGALGIRAACAYGDRALVGCLDGLWMVKKSSDFGEQPDLLQEVSREDRGAWKWLLGESPSTTVVRSLLGEIWAFNESRFLLFSREGHCIPGQWTDGRTVEDAHADPLRGLVMQMGDGHLCVIGEFTTDGASNLAGTNGTAVTWRYESGRTNSPIDVKRVILRVLSTGSNGSNVNVMLSSNEDESEVSLVGADETVESLPVERGTRAQFRSWFEIEMTGGASDTVFALGLEVEQRSEKR